VETTVDVWSSNDIHFDEVEGVFNSDRIYIRKSISIFYLWEISYYLYLIILYKIMNNQAIYAIAVFNENIKGNVKFTEDIINNRVKIDLNISGLIPNSLHGFHVHEAGDLTDKCTSMCAHFNPYGNTHGCPGMKRRHVGDLGNIKTNNKGEARYTFYDNIIKLRGTKSNIIGRGLIIHEDEDDCGKGGNTESLKTGNSGKRIACAVIGFSKENYK
jgi:Cu-Zn family superoxide dismutase